MQLAHTDHRHEDAQPAVELAAVAHRVVVRAGEQRASTPRAGRYMPLVHPHDVAHRVEPHVVEAALAHPRLHCVAQARWAAVRYVTVNALPSSASLCRASSWAQSQAWLPSTGTKPNFSFRRISAIRWTLRTHSASSKSG